MDEVARRARGAVRRPGDPRAEAALAALDQRVAAARDRAELLARTLADDLAAGKVPAPAAVDATPEQLGRPPVPAHTPATALRTFVPALVVAEAFFFSGPILAAQAWTRRASSRPSAPRRCRWRWRSSSPSAPPPRRSPALRVARSRRPARRRARAGTEPGHRHRGGARRRAPRRRRHRRSHQREPSRPRGAPRDRAVRGRLLLRAAARLQVSATPRSRRRSRGSRPRPGGSERARRTGDRRAGARRGGPARGGARRLTPPRPRPRAAGGERGARRRRAHPPRGTSSRAARGVAAGALELDRYAFLRLATEAAHDALVRPVRRIERSSERLGIAGQPRASALKRAASIASVGCSATRSPGRDPPRSRPPPRSLPR